jgi:hypothetical protein
MNKEQIKVGSLVKTNIPGGVYGVVIKKIEETVAEHSTPPWRGEDPVYKICWMNGHVVEWYRDEFELVVA